MDPKHSPRLWALVTPAAPEAEDDPAEALRRLTFEALGGNGFVLHAVMGDDLALRVLSRPRAADPSVVAGSVDLFEVTAGPGDDSEGRLRSVRAVFRLADGFEFSAYLMPDEAARVARHLKTHPGGLES